MTRQTLGKKRSETPTSLSRAMAASWFRSVTDVDFLQVLEDRPLDQQFERLRELMAAELPPHIKKHLLTVDEYLDASDRVRDSFSSAEDRERFLRYVRHTETEENVRTDAAFLLGAEIGRQVGGTR